MAFGSKHKVGRKESARGKTPTTRQVADTLRAIVKNRGGDTNIPDTVLADAFAQSFPDWRATCKPSTWKTTVKNHVRRLMDAAIDCADERDGLAESLEYLQSVKPGDKNPLRPGSIWCEVSIADQIRRVTGALEIANQVHATYYGLASIDILGSRKVSGERFVASVSDDMRKVLAEAERNERELKAQAAKAEKLGVDAPTEAAKLPSAAKK